MAAYYNEYDKKAAQWLRNLISAGLIAPGDVDDRSIADVSPDDLRGYTQCHFFAGIGIWSYALRRAGWSDDEPVWTMSCPCQPFSAAGATAGFADERHLWPFAAWLIEQRQPPKIFGEQVAGKIVDPWVDLVHADLEGMGYAFGAVPFPAASVRAPHVRDRLYWVGERLAHAGSERLEGGIHRRPNTQWQIEHRSVGRVRAAYGVAHEVAKRYFGSDAELVFSHAPTAEEREQVEGWADKIQQMSGLHKIIYVDMGPQGNRKLEELRQHLMVEDEANRRFQVMDNLPKSKKPRPPGDHIQRGKAWGKKNRRNKWH